MDKAERKDFGIAWAGVLGPPLIWFALQQAEFSLLPWACPDRWLATLHVLSIVAAILVLTLGWLNFDVWRRSGQRLSDNSGGMAGASGFLRLTSFLITAMFLLVVIAHGVTNAVLDPCL